MFNARRGQDVAPAYLALADKTRHGLVKDFREIFAWIVVQGKHSDNHALLAAYASHLEEGVDPDQLAERVEQLLRGPALSAGPLAGPEVFDFLVEVRAAFGSPPPKPVPAKGTISLADLADHVAAAKESDDAKRRLAGELYRRPGEPTRAAAELFRQHAWLESVLSRLIGSVRPEPNTGKARRRAKFVAVGLLVGLILCAGFLVAAAFRVPRDVPKGTTDETPPAADRIEGTWRVVSRDDTTNQSTQKLLELMFEPIGELGGILLEEEGSFEVSTNNELQEVDFLGGRTKARKQGIFKIEDEELTICIDHSGRSRPTAFEANQGQLIIYRRRPQDSSSPRGPMPTGLEGTWQGVWTQLPHESHGHLTSYFNELAFDASGKYQFIHEIRLGKYSVDLQSDPKGIDVSPMRQGGGGHVQQGIFVIEGDRLRLCFAKAGAPRPKEFFSAQSEIVTFERASPRDLTTAFRGPRGNPTLQNKGPASQRGSGTRPGGTQTKSSTPHADSANRIRNARDSAKGVLAEQLPKLLNPSGQIMSEYVDVLKEKQFVPSGINRILERNKYDKGGDIEGYRGGGAYFSFTTRTNDYNQKPDLELQQGRLCSGFYGGNFGLIKKLEGASIRKVALSAVPELLRSGSPEALHLQRESNYWSWSPKVELNATYAIRSVLFDEADTLAVFQVVQKDDDGITFVWRVLKQFPKPAYKERK
jgi:uncharacterized protein (TIGR03067 family)